VSVLVDHDHMPETDNDQDKARRGPVRSGSSRSARRCLTW